MKKTNAQFAAVFLGALLLHLAAATALMRSADTEPASVSVAMVDPTYHAPVKASGLPPGSPKESAAGASEALMPDAFELASETADPDPKPASITPPPIPPETRTAAEPKESESPTRRLTVNQLLASEKTPRVKRPDATGSIVETKEKLSPSSSEGPKIKPLPAIETGTTGPRKIRSLSGN